MSGHKSYKYLLLVIAFCLAFTVNAQVKLSVIPSKTTIQPGETFELEFIATGTKVVDEFTLPSFRQFEQVGKINQSAGATWINGELTDYISYTIALSPLVKGRLPIYPALVKVKGKSYTSEPLEITVAAETDKAVEEKPDYYLFPGENARQKIASNLFVQAIIDKKTCFTGEPVLATFKLLTRLNSESKILKLPSLNGFSVIDLDNNEKELFSKEKINGKTFNCYLIRKVQLFPLLSGELLIESVEVENAVHLIRLTKETNIKGGSSWLEAMMQKMKESEVSRENLLTENVLIKTPELKLMVQELPQKNKPENFSGAVGKFGMKAELLQGSITANDNAVLRITIKGSGNLPMITAPVINWPAGVDSFTATMKEELVRTTVPLSGIKTFDIPFSVSNEGLFEIPAISFSYFDPETKTYHSIASGTLKLNVTKAVKRKFLFQNNTTVASSAIPALVWASGVALILFSGSLFFFIRRKKEKLNIVPVQEVSSEMPVQKKDIADYLQPAVHVMGTLHHKQFYTLLLNAVHEFFYDRLHLLQGVASASLIDQTLKQKHQAGLALQFLQFRNDCELAIFSGVEITDAKDQLLEQAIVLMKEADKKI
ncbi:MAG: BatD family protein [Lacibacter sp.]